MESVTLFRNFNQRYNRERWVATAKKPEKQFASDVKIRYGPAQKLMVFLDIFLQVRKYGARKKFTNAHCVKK